MSDHEPTPIRRSLPDLEPIFVQTLAAIVQAKVVLDASHRLDPFVGRVMSRADYLRSPDGQAEMRLATQGESAAARAHRVCQEFLETGE